jgi:hypothetical protein
MSKPKIREGTTMTVKKLFAILFACLLTLLPACSPGTAPSAQEETAAIDTRVAELVAATADAQAAVGTSVAATLAAMGPGNPIATPGSEETPTPQVTNTPLPPMASVSVQTNCRNGPGSEYDVLGIMNVGETAEVVGKSLYADNWVIKLPSNPAITCTIWGQYATVIGDTAALPVINPPPTPTGGFVVIPPNTLAPSTGDFQFIYQSYWDCSGYSLVVFNLKNAGSLTWESNQVNTTDLVTSTTLTNNRNDFPNTFNCASISAVDNSLGAGQSGAVISASIPGNPTGHNFSATIQLCSGEGLTGFCLDKTISFIFTP